MYLGKAAGARGKILFGSQDPRRTAPPTAIALQAPETLACRPCRRRVCDQVGADQFACMDFDLGDGVEFDTGSKDAEATDGGSAWGWPEEGHPLLMYCK